MNNENNINGIPKINDVKIEDTPAESFASIYGNGAQPNQQQMTNPQIVQSQSVPVQPTQPTPQVVQQMPNPQQTQQPVQQPVQPQVAPVSQHVQPQPVQQPVPPIQPQPMANPQVVEPIQPVQVDADRLQAIEEQLSKTSQYKPEDFQQEKIDIPTTNQYEKNKSGLTFVIVLFIILVLAIAVSPFVSKFFS